MDFTSSKRKTKIHYLVMTGIPFMHIILVTNCNINYDILFPSIREFQDLIHISVAYIFE